MKKLWNWFVNWLTAPQREYVNYIFDLGKMAGRCELRTEQLHIEQRKEQEQDAH